MISLWGCSKNIRFARLQRGHRLHLWYIGKRTLVEMLTVRRVRHITLASSWRPARTGNTQGAQPPDNPASMCNGLQSKRVGTAISAFLGPHYVPLSPWSGPHYPYNTDFSA